MDKKKIEAKVKGVLGVHPDLFLLDVSITAKNNICLRLNGDRIVFLEDCSNISRYLDEQLNHYTEDYTLKVSSEGVGAP
ncbi:MAG: hypothetical protein ACMUEL_09390 [Flavobacteriales bacterium Tduv]